MTAEERTAWDEIGATGRDEDPDSLLTGKMAIKDELESPSTT